jgi:acyl-CoA thioesterase
MEERHFDLWEISALTGGVRITDISAIFREDNEQRTRVKFTLSAHVADPEPLTDTEIPDIETQKIDVIVVHPDETETEIEVNIENTENEDESTNESS